MDGWNPNTPHRPRVEWRGLKGIWGVTEADVTAPTDPVSVDVMTGCYSETPINETTFARTCVPTANAKLFSNRLPHICPDQRKISTVS